MQATLIDTRPKSSLKLPKGESSKADHSHPDLSPDLSVAELDERLEQAVQEHERSERLICDYLLEMRARRGYEKFGVPTNSPPTVTRAPGGSELMAA